MPIIGFDETPEPILIMPLYTHGNLSDVKETASKTQYISAFRQILLNLRHLYERGIVHRDLKPENIFIVEPFKIVITDFSLSKLARDGGLLKTKCGTYLYATPEISYGYGYGSEVDIWFTDIIIIKLIYFLPPYIKSSDKGNIR